MADPLAAWGFALGAVGAVAGVTSAFVAVVARRDSRKSATAAEGSLQVARDERARTVEQRDVMWSLDDDGSHDGRIVLRHIGTTTAYGVRAAVTAWGTRFDLTPGDVDPQGFIEHDASGLHAQAQADWEHLMATTMGFITLPDRPSTSVRITWTSRLGTPGLQVLGDAKA